VHCATQYKDWKQALPRGHWLLLEQMIEFCWMAHRKFPLPSTEPKAPRLKQEDPQVACELLIWKQPPWSES
jgi:hypothetical protein